MHGGTTSSGRVPTLGVSGAYWINEDVKPEADAWLAEATEMKGSWWLDWATWMQEHCGEQRAARKIGTTKYKAIEPAPGRYVRERAV